MLDHEEKFLFKEEIGHLGTAMADTAVLDNVEDLLTDVITSPRFDSEVFTLERSLQVMLGARAGSRMVITRGTRFIRPVFLSMVVLITLKMIYDNYLKPHA